MTALRVRIASAPSRPHLALRYRETVGYEVAAGALDYSGRDRPAGVQGLVVAQELALVPQVADARVGPGAPAAFQAGGVGLGGDLGGGPVAVAGQDREGLDRDPVLGGGVPGLVEAPRGAPYVLEDVNDVDDDVDGDAAAGGFRADQAQLVLGAVDEDDPGPQVERGRGPRPRRTRRRSCPRGPCGRTRPATWPGPSARAGARGRRSGRRAGRSRRAGGAWRARRRRR